MAVQTPTPDFPAARLAMIESQLRPQGVTDRGVLLAMEEVPRERFVPSGSEALAYVDRALPLGDGRYMVAPSVLGQLLTQMAPQRGERALVVGAGTGYSAAILSSIGLDVTALESSSELVAKAPSSNFVSGPLESGYRKGAPYDQILIDGAVEFIPDALIDQLADGGRLGTALIDRGISRLVIGRKAGGAFGYLSVADAGAPLLPGFSRPRAFTF